MPPIDPDVHLTPDTSKQDGCVNGLIGAVFGLLSFIMLLLCFGVIMAGGAQ